MLGSPTNEEMEFLLSHINKGTKVFEWGSGQSTIKMQEKQANIVSIEHNIVWYRKLQDKLKNVDYRYIPPNGPSSTPANPNHFINYINEIKKNNNKYDIVFVDGRARVDCAFAAYNHVDKFLFLHDWKHAKDNINDKKDRYNKILEKYELIEVVYTMAKFRRKKNV